VYVTVSDWIKLPLILQTHPFFHAGGNAVVEKGKTAVILQSKCYTMQSGMIEVGCCCPCVKTSHIIMQQEHFPVIMPITMQNRYKLQII